MLERHTVQLMWTLRLGMYRNYGRASIPPLSPSGFRLPFRLFRGRLQQLA